MEYSKLPANPFYEMYKDSGILTLAIPGISMFLVIGTTGILGNTAVILITISSKNLRSTTNYLLAFQCFFDSLHFTAHYYLAYVIYSGKNFDTLPTCYRIMVAPLIGLMFGIYLIFLIAFDRLIATFFPFRHQRMNKSLYLGSIMTLCIGVTAYIMYLGYLNAEANKDFMVVCLVVEGIHGPILATFTYMIVVLVLAAMAIYIIIGIYIRWRNDSSPTTKKLFKSLFILCMLMGCSWAFASIGSSLCFALGLSERLTFFVPLYRGLTLNIACASNFFVLTRYSSEYRTAAREFFSKFGITAFFKPIVEKSKVLNIASSQKVTAPTVPIDLSASS